MSLEIKFTNKLANMCGLQVKLCLSFLANLSILYNYSKNIIYSYRIQQAIKNDILQNVEDKVMICQKIIYAVDIHRKSLRYLFDGMDMI